MGQLTPLLIRFSVSPINYEIRELSDVHGPLFHRWLPNGRDDAIELSSGDPSASINIWFERTGFVIEQNEHNEIYFDPSRCDVDPKVMETQGILNAGTLYGELQLGDYTEEEIDAVRNADVGATAYTTLAKRVLRRFIEPTISGFIRVLQLDFGQYWLRTLRPWDSRHEPLDSYCSGLQMRWSLDGGKSWEKFFSKSVQVYSVVGRFPSGHHRFITEADWRCLGELIKQAPLDLDSNSDLAFRLLMRSRELLDIKDDVRLALLEAVTAAEVYIKNAKKRKDIVDYIKLLPSFDNIKASEQLAILASITGNIPLEQVTLACRAWGYRNEVVHDGWFPNSERADEVEKSVLSLIVVIGLLMGRPSVKIVSACVGNSWSSPDGWEKQYERESAL